MGLSRKEFYEMRPGEFWEALAAYQEKLSADRRHIGELVRGATLRMFNLQVDKQYRQTDPAKFWPMPWDQPDKAMTEIKRLGDLTEEERQNEVKKFFERISHGKHISKSEG